MKANEMFSQVLDRLDTAIDQYAYEKSKATGLKVSLTVARNELKQARAELERTKLSLDKTNRRLQAAVAMFTDEQKKTWDHIPCEGETA